MTEAHVSIRELKSRLRYYLSLVRNGESLVITDRGVPIGRIVPIGRGCRGAREGGALQAGDAQVGGNSASRWLHVPATNWPIG
jgi:prevent-host-death family protein